MLDKTVCNQFKVSNTPNLTGWNSTMTICIILEQLEASYGKPDTMTLFRNNTLFQSPFPPTEAPEMLFYRIKQCQEIQTLAQDPYSNMQIINNALRLLMQPGIFPLKDFDTWETITPKMYPSIKTFIPEAYTRCLMAMQLRNTAGVQGYAPNNNQNMYNILDDLYDTDSGTKGTVATQTAPITHTTAMTMGSMLGNTYGATIPSEISNAINQLMANQSKLQLVEPHNHRVNAAERAIQTFKDAFIAALAMTDSNFPLQLWDKITPQVQDTLKMMRASRIDPTISAYEALNGPYDWNRYPLAPLGCKAVVYEDGDSRGS